MMNAEHWQTIREALQVWRGQISLMPKAIHLPPEIKERFARIDAALAAVEAAQQQPVALDAPDGPGWWAFEGGLNYGDGIILAMHIEMPVRVYPGRITNEWQTQSQIGHHPARHLDGKWTRVYMPWEQQP